MKILRISALFFLSSICVLSSVAQDVGALMKKGNKLFKDEQYRNALPFFEQVLKQKPEEKEAIFKAGVCYLHRYSKEKALELLLKAYSVDSTIKHIDFWLARAYHQNYQFDKAIQHYTKYSNSLSKRDDRRKDMEKYIAQTNTAKEFVNNPQNYIVRNMGEAINTSFSEHSPVGSINDDYLLFTSRRDNVTGGKEDLDGEFFEDIFQSKKVGNVWSKPEIVSLSTTGHDASIQLYDNDTKLLIYKFTKGGDIYYSEKEGDQWKEPKQFPGINTRDYEADAFITADGKTLYFATNHYKKEGDLDIYYITKDDNGNWSKPKELKGKINTDEDEDAPFITPDGNTLYFSSRGHKNMGGYDVFKSTKDANGNWSEPVNLGHPINTPDDDVYFYLVNNGKKGYLASYREGGYGEKDIYEILPIQNVIIKGIVTADGSGKPLDNLGVTFTSIKNTTTPNSDRTMTKEGAYTAKVFSYNSYKAAVLRNGDTLYTEIFEIPYYEEPDYVIEKNFSIPWEEEEQKLVSHKYLFRQIYFDRNRGKLTPEGKRELDFAIEILKKNPTAQVRLIGSRESRESKRISEERAKSTYEYLKQAGVDMSRVKFDTIALGKDMPGSDLKRSVDFDVTFDRPIVMEFDTTIVPRFAVGDNFILRTVYFETAKFDVLPESMAELKILKRILDENPTLKIEVGGHTDSRGHEWTNKVLSENRAKSVVNFLIKEGIDPSRLTAKGYGESYPIAPNETSEGRKLNRRTEFKILSK
ncbi:MAG TPA: OmpA family protein [Cytophagaceae bacterium]